MKWDTISSQLKKYNNHPLGKVLELELKLLLDPRIQTPKFIERHYTSVPDFIGVCKTMLDDLVNVKESYITQTINFIAYHSTNKTFIKQLVYENGVQIKSKKNFYYKKSLISPDYILSKDKIHNFKINLNEETASSELYNMQYNIIRFRLRKSIMFTEESPYKNWRIDFTLIKETNDFTLNNLQKIRDNLFISQQKGNITSNNFTAFANWNFADRIEIEFEYIGSDILNITYDGLGVDNLRNIFCAKKSCISQIYIYKISKILKKHSSYNYNSDNGLGLKQLLCNPVEMTKKQYYDEIQPNIKNFYVTEKTDGIRSLVIINMVKRIGVYIISDKLVYFNIDTFTLNNNIDKTYNIWDRDDKVIIIDTEKYNNTFYVFDIIKFNDIDVSKFKFADRLEYCMQTVELLNSSYTKSDTDAIHFYLKKFSKLNADNYKELIMEKLSENSLKESVCRADGLIFTLNSKLCNYSNTKHFKWKSVDDMTIDFLARKCPDEMLGIHPYINKPGHTLYLLFSGIQYSGYKKSGIQHHPWYYKMFNFMDVKHLELEKYIPILFSPSTKPYAHIFWSNNINGDLDNKIVELNYDMVDNWILRKIRDDRNIDLKKKMYYGNYFKIAECIWMSYHNPLSINQMCGNDDSINQICDRNTNYFKKNTNKLVNIRKFNNFVKEKLIEMNKDTDWVVDLGSGRGQDIFKYTNRNIGNIVMIENDKNAIDEIMNRKYMFIYNHLNTNLSSNIYVHNTDINTPYDNIYNNIIKLGILIPPGGVKLLVCNFAIHYFIGNSKNINNFIELSNKLLAVGGKLIISCFNGRKIFDLLNNNNGKWEILDSNNNIKYSIKYSTYKNKPNRKLNLRYKTFTGFNQSIDVILPFSNCEYYSEYLVNNDIIEKKFSVHNIKLESSNGFNNFFNEYELLKNKNRNNNLELSDDDKQYASLYDYYIYTKCL
jgi:hypothetical protein